MICKNIFPAKAYTPPMMILAVISLLTCPSGRAQSTPGELCAPKMAPTNFHQSRLAAPYYDFETWEQGWRFVIIPYVWVAAIDGTSEVSGVSTPVNISLGDVFTDLDPALSLHLEGWSGQIGFFLDGSYLNQEGKNLRTANGLTVNVKLEMVLSEFKFSYRLGEPQRAFEPFIGFRFTDLRSSIASTQALQSAAGSESWFDPLVGGRFRAKFSSKLGFVVSGDVGGFGAGSDLTWNATAALGLELSPMLLVTGGYRLMDVDYKKEEGNNSFVFDARQSGMVVGVAFRF